MCSYVVFFILSFLSLGLDKRLLQDPANPIVERRDLGMFGHETKRHYEDYFAGGHSNHARRRHERRSYQTPVGGDIKIHQIPDHFPFDKEDGDHWKKILEKSKSEADAMAAKSKAADDAAKGSGGSGSSSAKADATAKKGQTIVFEKEKKAQDEAAAKAKLKAEAEAKAKAAAAKADAKAKAKADEEAKKEKEDEQTNKNDEDDESSPDSEGEDNSSGGCNCECKKKPKCPCCDQKPKEPACPCAMKQDTCPCNQNVSPGGTSPMQAPQTPQYLVKMANPQPQQPMQMPPIWNPQNNGLPEKHGLQATQAYVPDTVPQKKACEFTPAECFCGSRPTQQMDLLCASKKREYCGWFCKHKMGGREGKPKTGPNQWGTKPKPLNPTKRANPEECAKPSLKTCEAIYSDPNSPDYVGDGYAPPGANCVCHIDQKTGHAVITDLPNTAAIPGANTGAPASSGAPAASGSPAATGAATSGAAPATSGAPAGSTAGAAPATSGAPSIEAANSNGAGPDSGNSGNAATNAINSAAADAVQGVQNVQNTVNAAGKAATDTVNAASQAVENVQEESKGMWHHAKGFANAAGGHVANAASGIWNGVKGVGKAIFGDEAEAQLQSGYPGGSDTEYYLSGGEHPTRGETSVSANNGLGEVFEDDDEVALGITSDFGVH